VDIFPPGEPPSNWKNLSTAGLLRAYGEILDELRSRGIVRSSNSPLSDYAEVLFCEAFGWNRQHGNAAGFDAVNDAGVRFQIKGRRLTKHRRSSRQLSAIRGLDGIPFDFLAAVLVDDAFQIIRAILVPVAIVRAKAVFVKHTNSHKFHLRDDVWEMPDVEDVTAKLRAVASRFDLLP
jgi:hypothetical protein